MMIQTDKCELMKDGLDGGIVTSDDFEIVLVASLGRHYRVIKGSKLMRGNCWLSRTMMNLAWRVRARARPRAIVERRHYLASGVKSSRLVFHLQRSANQCASQLAATHLFNALWILVLQL